MVQPRPLRRPIAIQPSPERIGCRRLSETSSKWHNASNNRCIVFISARQLTFNIPLHFSGFHIIQTANRLRLRRRFYYVLLTIQLLHLLTNPSTDSTTAALRICACADTGLSIPLQNYGISCCVHISVTDVSTKKVLCV